MKKCPVCKHKNSDDNQECDQCQCSLKPIYVGQSEIKIGPDASKGKIHFNLPQICYSCCSEKNLISTSIESSKAVNNSVIRYKVPLHICNECQELLKSPTETSTSFDIKWFMIICMPFLVFVFISCFVLQTGLSCFISSILFILSAVILAKTILPRAKMLEQKTRTSLIEKYGHTYQPLQISEGSFGGNNPLYKSIILEIYNKKFAEMTKKLNL